MDAHRNHIFNGFPNACEEGYDPIPDIREEGGHGCPQRIPACAEPSEEHISNTLQHIEGSGQNPGHPIPDTGEYLFDTVPHLRPVSGEQTYKHIEDADNDIKDCTKHRADNRKCRFKHRGKYLTEAVPYGLQHFHDILEIKAEGIKSFGDRLTERCKLHLPHARGDEPIIATVVATAIIFAPRTWGEIFKRGWIK